MDGNASVEELLLDDSFISYCWKKNPGDVSRWEIFIKSNPGVAPAIEEARRLVFAMTNPISKSEIRAEIHETRKLIKGMAGDENADVDVSERYFINASGKLRRPVIAKIAVYSLLAIGVLLSTWYAVANIEQKSSTNNSAVLAADFANPHLGRKSLVLPDGSEVILNSFSELQLQKDFNSKKRELKLKGSAFFKVAKDPSRPFVVTAAGISTTALGTEFYVRSNATDSAISVDLLEGRVKLQSEDPQQNDVILIPGQQGTMRSGKAAIVKSDFDTASLKQWVSAKLSFNKTPLKRAIADLEKWYAVSIDLQNKDEETRLVTGDYQNASLDDVLQVICFSLSCHYSRIGNKIAITF